MRTHRLTDSARSTLTNALRVAAERYTENARELRAIAPVMLASAATRLAEQFDRQAREASRLRLILEESEDVLQTIDPTLVEPGELQDCLDAAFHEGELERVRA